MATPAVSGIAALVWSNHPGCTGTQIRNALKATAKDAGAAGKDVLLWLRYSSGRGSASNT